MGKPTKISNATVLIQNFIISITQEKTSLCFLLGPVDDNRRRFAADYVEYERGFGSNETSGNAGFRRNVVEPSACSDCYARNFLLAAPS